MKLFKLCVILGLGLFLTACASPPDLVIDSIVLTGNPVVLTNGDIQVPIHVVVKSQLDKTPAAISTKVAIIATDESGNSYVVPFTVPGQDNTTYPFTGSILSGGSVTLNGIVTLKNYPDFTVALKAQADSCEGDVGLPAYCRIKEVKEDNNFSSTISIELYPS